MRAPLEQLSRRSLVDFERVSLMSRIDTKFVLSIKDLAGVLTEIRHRYGVLDIDGRLLHHYENQYFDTFDRALFRAHHNVELDRYKYRYRRYDGTDLVFFEVKRKTNAGRMVKKRVQVERFGRTLSTEARGLIAAIGAHDADELIPSLRGTFHHLSLQADDRTERVTIDVGLTFAMAGRTAATRHLVVAEVKQSRFDARSPLMVALAARGVRPSRFSKYCVGLLAVDRGRKHNAFKPLLRAVERIEQPEAHDGGRPSVERLTP